MTTLSIADLKILQDLFVFSSFIGSICFLMLFYVLYQVYRFLAKQINIPKRINTQHGHLFRSLSGIYVREDELDDFNASYLYSNKQRSIRILQHRLNSLQSSIETPDSN